MTDIEYIEWRIRYEGEGAFVSLPIARVRNVLDEVRRLTMLVDEYRSRETLPMIGGADVE